MRRRRLCRAISCAVVVLGAAALLAPPAGAAASAQKVQPASGPPIPVTFLNLDATSSTLPARQGGQREETADSKGERFQIHPFLNELDRWNTAKILPRIGP